MRQRLHCFEDRRSAGQILAEQLRKNLTTVPDIVLGLPRGGVPVAYEVAKHFHLPLDVFVVRKLGVPGHSELAMGAIASGGVRVYNQDVVRSLRVDQSSIDRVAEVELQELKRRELEYRGDRPPVEVTNRRVLVVDDGLATGATMRAAVAALRKLNAARIIVAIPVAPPDTVELLANEADQVECVMMPENFAAVGEFYMDFSQTTDAEVEEYLHVPTTA